MWECHSDGRNRTEWLNLLSIFLDLYELRRNWASKTNLQQQRNKISQYPALLISHLLITHIYLIYISSSTRVKVDPSHWKSICKTLRKYSASNYQRSLKMLSNPTTRHSWCRPVMPEVDLKDTSKISRKWPRKGVTSIVESNDSSRLMSTRQTGSRFARHLENIGRVTTKGSWRYCRIDSIRLESNDSSQLMSTRHSGSRFARYLENIPQVVTKGGCRFSRIERIP